MAPQDLQTLLALFLRDLYAGTVGLTSGVGLSLTDGTASANSGGLQFASEPTLRFYRSAAATVKLQGHLQVTGDVVTGAANGFNVAGRVYEYSPATGVLNIANAAITFGVQVKVDALPTVASGFGTSPAITAGSTPLAGSVDVGTGGAATSGVINFNGTAFPSAPFVVACNKTTNAVVRATASTTQLTLSSTTAWGANDIVSWIAISSK